MDDHASTAIMDQGGEATIDRFLAALHPTRKERALSWLVGRCYDRNGESGPWNWLGDRADDLRVWLQNRRADKGVGWSRLATVGRKVNSADRTSTPPRHLPPLPDECYPPGAVPIPYEPDSGARKRRPWPRRNGRKEAP